MLKTFTSYIKMITYDWIKIFTLYNYDNNGLIELLDCAINFYIKYYIDGKNELFKKINSQLEKSTTKDKD